MPLRPGDAVEHFVIVSLLGEGGMGQVYVARDTRLQRSVALKIVQPETGDAGSVRDSGGAARLLREAQSAAALEHPNVVTIYEVGRLHADGGEENGQPFIAMELVRGRPLRSFVGDTKIPLGQRVKWLVDVARALGAAHAVNLVHRDVKPENVMVRDDGVIKVLDFGIAKRAASASASSTTSTEAQVFPSLTGKGVAVGTPYYMAPEQMRRETLDGRADQFSWGVVAYELLSGTPPWGVEVDALELVSKLLTEDPPPLAQVSPHIPPHVAEVVARAMSKKRGDRFAKMEDVVAALEDAVGVFAPTLPRISVKDVIVPEAQSGPSERQLTTAPVRPAPRSRRGVVLAGAGVVACALALGAALYGRTRGVHEGSPPVAAPQASAAKEPGFPDFGSPPSKNPEATAAYRKGMTALRDADADGALRELDRALALDPGFAAAHLRRGVWRIPLLSADRTHTQEAVRLRETLGPHDRVFLDAVAPLLEVPENHVEAAKRLAAALERAPADADFALALCRARQATGELQEARTVCARARELDPGAAAPILEVALAKVRLEDAPGALVTFAECLRASPLATSCLEPLWELQTFEGSCTDALATARRLVSINPDSADVYDDLAVALAGAGEPIESVRLALAEKLGHLSAEEAKITKLRDAVTVDLFAGNFADADAQLRAWEDAASGSRLERDHMPLSAARIQLAEEQGRKGDAVSLLGAYLKQRPAWTLSAEDDYSMPFVGELYALGALPRGEFVAKRARWLAGEKMRSSRRRFPWVDAYALPARSEADAREALDVLPQFLPLPDPLNRPPEWEGPIGRTYHLAGHDSDAIPFLSRAARSCALLQAPFEQTAAGLDLGLALEGVGKPAAACDEYRIVVRQWGRAQASITAAKARERLKALRCPE